MISLQKIKRWKDALFKHKYKLLLAFILLIASLILQVYASNYVTTTTGNKVNDLILDHIPAINLNFLYSYFFLFFTNLIWIYALFFLPNHFYFYIGQMSILTLLRDAFITLTHLQSPVGALPIYLPGFIEIFNITGNDLFFSGHVAAAFLGFLLIKTKLRYFFLIASFISAATVLFMHRHYSIDVFAAFFIAYGSYKIGNWIFIREKKKNN